MRIEISSSGFGGAAISNLQSNLSAYIGDAESVLASFKTIKENTVGLNGGAGNLQGALENVDSRVRTEESKLQDAKAIQNRVNEFVSLAVRVDQSVSEKVNRNKNELYRVNPWLKPATSVDEEVPWYEQAWNWLCGAGEAITDGAKQVWNWVSDTAVKVWNGIVELYQEHKRTIDTILIVVATVAAIATVIVTGGLALVPLLAAVGFSSATAIAISSTVAVVAVVSTIGSSTLNIVDIWAEIDNPVFNTFQKALNITSTLTNLAYSVGNIYNSINGVSPNELQTFRNQNYTRDEIRVAVKQDACIKKFPKKLTTSDNKNLVKGNYGEMMQDRQMRIAGYKRISNPTVSDYTTPLGHGIDGVYTDGTSFVIGDAKFGTATLQMTKDGMQMSPSWIENRLELAVGFETSETIIEQGYSSQVFHVDGNDPKRFWVEILK